MSTAQANPVPAYEDEATWSYHSREWLRSDDVPLTTAEIEAEGELVDECADCGARVEPVVEDKCPECGRQWCMTTGRRFSYGLQDYFVSYL